MTQDPRRFYVYLFLRSTGSVHDKKYSPYYVGKGSGNRCYGKSGRPANRPKDISYIVTVQEGLTEEEAFSLERYCIALYGRLDIKTGILHNRTDGGEGRSGYVATEEMKKKISQTKTGELNPNWGKTHSPETRRRISEGQRGRKQSEETKQKIALTKVRYLYELIDPDDEIYITDNLREFSKQYGLTNSSLSLVVKGKHNHHKGWTGRIVEQLR
jgi:hypothetical protein